MDFIILALAIQLVLLLPFLLARPAHASGHAASLAHLRRHLALLWNGLQCPFRHLLPSETIQTGSCSSGDSTPDQCPPPASSIPTASEAPAGESVSSAEFARAVFPSASPSGSPSSLVGPFWCGVSLANFFSRRLQKLFGPKKNRPSDHPFAETSFASGLPCAIAATTAAPLSAPLREPVPGRHKLIHPAISPTGRALLAQKLLSIDRRIKSQRSVGLPGIILEATAAEEARN